MKQTVIGVDVDDVCADLLTAWLARYNRTWNDSLTVDQVTEWNITKFVKCGARIFDLLDPSVYEEVKPLPGALETVNRLRAIGRVVFITTGNGDAKLAWLLRHGFLPQSSSPFVHPDFFVAYDKTLVRADFLFDDHVKNVESFPGFGYLVPQAHNASTPCGKPRLRAFSAAPEIVENVLQELGQ